MEAVGHIDSLLETEAPDVEELSGGPRGLLVLRATGDLAHVRDVNPVGAELLTGVFRRIGIDDALLRLSGGAEGSVLENRHRSKSIVSRHGSSSFGL